MFTFEFWLLNLISVDSFIQAVMGFRLDGKIHQPNSEFDNERVRFEHRFGAFGTILTPSPGAVRPVLWDHQPEEKATPCPTLWTCTAAPQNSSPTPQTYWTRSLTPSQRWEMNPRNTVLKGKFSSGIEGALASTLNRDFNWKQLSEIILCNFFDVFKVYLSNIGSETAEILRIRRLWILGMGVTIYYDLKYNC